MSESVVITVPPGTARLYLPEPASSQVLMSDGTEARVPFGERPPDRVWVGVPELPTVLYMTDHRDPDVFEVGERPLGPGDAIVLAEPCEPCEGTGCEYPDMLHISQDERLGIESDQGEADCTPCKGTGLVPLVSARVADDDQPSILPVEPDAIWDGVTLPALCRSTVEPEKVFLRHDPRGEGLYHHEVTELPGDWWSARFGVRVAGAEDYVG